MRGLAGSIFFVAFLFSCAPVKYFTTYEGGFDPLYDMKKAKTIGFIPMYWTAPGKRLGYDALVEKQMFVCARDELQKRGYKVFYITPDFLYEDSTKHRIHINADYKDMPDLALTIDYWQGLGNKVQVPGQSAGLLNWGNNGGAGYYGQTQGYEVQTYLLALSFTLWSDAPKFGNKAWSGIIKKGSPKLDLFEQAPSMTTDVFWQKFDR